MTELGEIPEKWYISKLDELAQIKRGASPRPINNPKWFSEKKNVGWIRISDVTKTKKYLNSTEQYLSDEGIAKSRLVKPNDLIMSICATVGKPIILNIDACIHDGFILFDNLNNNKIITEYLYYLLQKKEEEFKGMGQTGTQANLNTNIVGSTLIAIPTIEEQKKIALILSTVDEEINNVDALIEKNKELKKGLMQTLLTKGIGHTKFKKTEIGEIPEEWGVEKLGNIVEVISGATPKTNINEYWDNGDIYWATPTDITSNGKYISITEKTITESGLKNCSAKLLPIGSILMSSRATIGERCINTVPMATNQGFKSLVCKARVNNEFIYYYIDILKEKLIGLASGSTFLEVSKKVVEDVKVAVPSLEEQEKIVSILSEIDDKIHEYENKKQKLEELKKGLMQQLLTGKMRVDLSV